MAHPLFVLNGSNLNMLGVREPGLYGTTTLAEIEERTRQLAESLGLACDFRQTNHEGVLIDAIHEARADCEAVVINPGAFTHTSVALRDALTAVALPVAEVHISNVHAREEFRHHSFISGIADCVIVGCGVQGYELAVRRIAALLSGA